MNFVFRLCVLCFGGIKCQYVVMINDQFPADLQHTQASSFLTLVGHMWSMGKCMTDWRTEQMGLPSKAL